VPLPGDLHIHGVGMSDIGNSGPKGVIRDLFPSPVGVFDWPDSERLNAELRAAIMERYESSPGIVSSNRNGWHSKWDLHRWPEPCVQEFLSRVQASSHQLAAHVMNGATKSITKDWTIRKCWANVNPPGGYNQAHHHIGPGALLSGVYYVDIGDCPDPEYAGRTILQDRSGIALPKGGDMLSRERAITPKPGALVLFPAALMHYVEPYRGKTRRISIAFDLGHPELEALYYDDMAEASWWWRNFRGLMLLKTKVPEKARAYARFMSYLGEEFRKPKATGSIAQRLRTTRHRAEADEADARDADRLPKDGSLPDKRPFM
jgi:uncharacterized protein (TIGR02466 family)